MRMARLSGPMHVTGLAAEQVGMTGPGGVSHGRRQRRYHERGHEQRQPQIDEPPDPRHSRALLAAVISQKVPLSKSLRSPFQRITLVGYLNPSNGGSLASWRSGARVRSRLQ